MTRNFMFRFPKLINLYPPFLGARIRMTHLSYATRTITSEMKLSRGNRNYVGTHFGGSLFAMTDPFYMLLLLNALGPGHIVWDKAASIRFRRPGTGTVRAHFKISDERLAEIQQALAQDGIYEPTFSVEIVDLEGAVIAIVERTLYCATKAAHAARTATRQLRSV